MRSRTTFLRRRPHSRGQALVEAAIIMPIIVMILLLTIDLGRAYFAHLGLRNAAREAAIYGGSEPMETCASGSSDAGLRYQVAREFQVNTAAVGCDSGTVSIVTSGSEATGCFQYPSYAACGGAPLNPTATYLYRVHVTTDFQPVTPIVGLLTGNGFGNAVPLSVVTSSPVLSGYGS